MRYRRGKRDARPGAVKLKFGSYYGAASLPTTPLVVGAFDLWPKQWFMLGNDRVGDCVVASAEHGEMLTRAANKLTPVLFTTGTAITDYSAIGGYVIGDETTDQGLDLQVAAAYRQSTGLLDASGQRHKIGIYTALHLSDVDELMRAIYLFGAVDIGLRLPDSAEGQFDRAEPWDVLPGDTPGGGHCVCGVGRNNRGNILVITWGRLHAMTPRFFETYMDEGVSYIPEETATPALLDDFKQVTA